MKSGERVHYAQITLRKIIMLKCARQTKVYTRIALENGRRMYRQIPQKLWVTSGIGDEQKINCLPCTGTEQQAV